MADTCCEVTHSLPVPFHCDAKYAIYIASNQVYPECTKHIEIDYHLVHENFDKGLLVPVHISTASQLADIFTKAVGSTTLTSLSSKLQVCDLFQPSNLRGDVNTIIGNSGQ